MKKVTLWLSDGQELTFSNVEEIFVCESNVKSEESKTKVTEIVQKPQEGKWFCVNPLAIDKNLFKKKREHSKQEVTRQLILEAFEEMKKNSKYARPFKTMMPEKTWSSKTVRELKELASKLGDHNADWVEQALEWAQRIANGEAWEDICNKADTANCYRLVVWKDGHARIVGGSRKGDNRGPASDVVSYAYLFNHGLSITVPLVVSYDV